MLPAAPNRNRYEEDMKKHLLLTVGDDSSSLFETVTIFHVGNGENGTFDEVLERVRQNLNDNGVSKDRIKNKMIYSPRVIRSIVDEAVRGAYAVVALGHRRRFRPDGFKD